MGKKLNALWDNQTSKITAPPPLWLGLGGLYGETGYQSPTARIFSVYMQMQLALQDGMVVHQMDVKTAYLNAPIDCELYIEQPEDYER